MVADQATCSNDDQAEQGEGFAVYFEKLEGLIFDKVVTLSRLQLQCLC
jgi:hypothetical protein